MRPVALARVVAVAAAVLVATVAGWGAGGPSRASAEPDQAGAPRAGVNLVVDYSKRPTLVIEARGVSADELLRSLGRELGFESKRIGKAGPGPLVHGRFVGELEDLLPWLLRHENHAVELGELRPDGRRQVARVLLFDAGQGDRMASGSRDFTLDPAPAAAASADQVRAYLASATGINRDMRTWLEAWLARAEAGTAPEISVNLYDAPVGVSDMLRRLTDPLAPGFARSRLENRGPGTPPRYLTGANDAAQQDVAAALARTTALARRNLGALTEALGKACLGPQCPGITRTEIEARDRQLREEAARPKGAR